MPLRLRTLIPSCGLLTLLLLSTSLASPAFAQLLYVPAYGTNLVVEYTTAPSGTLASVPCTTGSSPTNSIATGTQPESAVMTPSGNFLYVTDKGIGQVLAFTVNNTAACYGELAPLGTYTLASAWGAASDPTGSYLFVAQGGSNQLTSYQIANGTPAAPGTPGTLNFIGSVSTGAGSAPQGVATALVSGNLYVYVALGGLTTNNVAVFSATNGTLSSAAVGTGTVPAGAWDSNTPFPSTNLSSPQNLLAFNGTLYVTDPDAGASTGYGLSVFTLNANGSLTGPTNYNTGSGPQGLATDGTYLYVANQYDPSVWAYPLSNLSTHVAKTSAAGLGHPWGVTVDPLTNTVYVSDIGTNSVFGFTADLGAAVTGSPWSTGTNSQPAQFLLAHRGPTPAATTSVPAASCTSLALMALLLAACAGMMYRKSIRPSSAQ